MSGADEGYVIIAYWGDDRNVRYVCIDTVDSYINQFTTIAGAFERFICHGQVTEVLEVQPKSDIFCISERCDYWREVLRDQGYEINRRGEE